jgi:glutamate--cysteine ligase catalytic subunit
MLALTASSPFWHGKIAATDVRWDVISQSVDDRTDVERGVADNGSGGSGGGDSSTSASGNGTKRVRKSRYDSIDSYLGDSEYSHYKREYDDVDLEIDDDSYATLRAAGVDETLARHVAHLFIRDPLVIYDGNVEEVDDETSSDHFENIQSTNWQSVRFKPPPAAGGIGWRVEFRTMELQLTDFENAAFTVFIALLSRAILFFNVNLYIPISKVDENMRAAHRMDAVNRERFHWRSCTSLGGSFDGNDAASAKESGGEKKGAEGDCSGKGKDDGGDDGGADKYEQMTMEEIFMGRTSTGGSDDNDGGGDCGCSGAQSTSPGLLPLVRSYLSLIKCDSDTKRIVDRYLTLIEMRATGKLMTTATWLRGFVAAHPAYKQDSQLSDVIVYDLARVTERIVNRGVDAPQLLGTLYREAMEVTSPLVSLPTPRALAASHATLALSVSDVKETLLSVNKNVIRVRSSRPSPVAASAAMGELNESLQKEEQKKREIQEQLRLLTESLAASNKNIAQLSQARNNLQ